MNRQLNRFILILSCTLFPPLALAHGGNGESGLVAGLLHPFTGLDHLLAALACGIWMKCRLEIPPDQGMGVFLLPLLAGMLLGANGLTGLYLEGLLSATVVLLAVLLLPGVQLRRNLGIGLAASLALLQGLAHGGEIVGLSLEGSITALAVCISTGLLLAGGYVLASGFRKAAKTAF